MKKRLGTKSANQVIRLLSTGDLIAPPKQLVRYLDCPSGIDIEITKVKPDRTRSQEKYYRKWCGEFAKHSGVSPDSMHEVLLMETYGSAEISTRKHVYRIPAKRSADTTRDTYSELIETLIRCASFAGFVIPPAERAA